MLKILNEIAAERQRQDAKWGEQNWNPVEWVAILGEEFGEVSKEAVEYHFIGKHSNMDENKADKVLQNYRKELIQTAAVCLAMIQSLERNELG